MRRRRWRSRFERGAILDTREDCLTTILLPRPIRLCFFPYPTRMMVASDLHPLKACLLGARTHILRSVSQNASAAVWQNLFVLHISDTFGARIKRVRLNPSQRYCAPQSAFATCLRRICLRDSLGTVRCDSDAATVQQTEAIHSSSVIYGRHVRDESRLLTPSIAKYL